LRLPAGEDPEAAVNVGVNAYDAGMATRQRRPRGCIRKRGGSYQVIVTPVQTR
jgi:hypothetical protein